MQTAYLGGRTMHILHAWRYTRLKGVMTEDDEVKVAQRADITRSLFRTLLDIGDLWYLSNSMR